MKKDITLQDLNDHYSGKKNLRENMRIFEDGTALDGNKLYAGVPPIRSKKISSITAYFYDIDLKPVTYQLDYIFDVVFDYIEITSRYSSDVYTGKNNPEQPNKIEPTDADVDDAGKEIGMDDPNVKSDKKDMKSVVDHNEFYHDYYTKKLPTYAVSKILRDLIRTGKLNMGEFEIVALNYPTIDDKALFNQFVANHKAWLKNDKGEINKPIKYGYSITIGAKNGRSEINTLPGIKVKTKLTQFSTYFTEIFEREILAETDYFDFVKK